MTKKLFLIIGAFFLSAYTLYAAVPSGLTRDLKVGDRGPDVLLLQQILNVDAETRIAATGVGSPGFETDYLGPLTKAAVIKFQRKYRSEVLYPAGILGPTGFVGVMTRAKLTALAQAPKPPQTTTATTNKTTKPIITSVSPDHVRLGDNVTVTGENFTPTNNTIVLGDGPIETRFENLPSPDGKTITFVYKPPEINTMSESEIRALPADIVSQIETPIKAAGGTLADVLIPYKDFHNESELRASLEKNNYSFDGLYHYFWVSVDNGYGRGLSKTALLHGIRKFPFNSVAGTSGPLFSALGRSLHAFAEKIVPVAHAQVGGGIYSLVLVCTCSGAMVTFNLPAGLLVWQPGFIPLAGSCRIGGFWLGYYLTSGGICPMYIGLACVTLTFGMPLLPFGCSL